MENNTILVVEDEQKIADITAAYLRKVGYKVVVAGDGKTALRLFELEKPVLLVLDLMLPDMSGEEICRRVRSTSDVAVIMVTARSSEAEKISGLDLGADDYVTKPFSPRELVARVRSVLRRSSSTEEEAIEAGEGDLTIDPARHEVIFLGKRVSLTAHEFKLLLVMAREPGRVFSRLDLINKVQGYDFEGYERTIDAHVKNLRHKVGEGGQGKDHRFIKTVFGVGYKFEG